MILDAEIGEADAAAAAQQTPIPVEVNVPVVLELSLVELTQVWHWELDQTEACVDQRSGTTNPAASMIFAFKFSNWLSGLPGDAEVTLEGGSSRFSGQRLHHERRS